MRRHQFTNVDMQSKHYFGTVAIEIAADNVRVFLCSTSGRKQVFPS